jgi:hypothetical protein
MSHEDEKGNERRPDDLGRRKLLKRGVILAGASALASALGLTPFVGHADAVSSGEGSPTVKVVELSAAEQKRYIGLTLASSHYRAHRQQQQSRLSQGFSIAESKAEARLLDDGTTKTVVVRIPIEGGAGYSYYAESYQYQTSNLLDTMAGLFSVTADKNIAAVCWKNGKEVVNVVITPDGKQMLSGTVLSSTGQVQTVDSTAFNWNCAYNKLSDCLGWFGVPGWLIAIAGAACGLGCFFSAGIGCLICLAAVFYVSTGIVGFCSGYAVSKC